MELFYVYRVEDQIAAAKFFGRHSVTQTQEKRIYTMKRLFAILALASTIALPVYAQEFGDTAGGGAESSMEFRAETDELASLAPGMAPDSVDFVIGAGAAGAADALALSDDQLEKIAKLRNDLRDSSAGKKAQLQTLHRQLKDALISEKTDKAAVLDINSKMNSLKAELSTARLNARLETLAVLTPEQKAKMRHKALQREAFGCKMGMRGKGHHGGHHGRGHGRQGRPGGSCAVPGEAPESAQSEAANSPV